MGKDAFERQNNSNSMILKSKGKCLHCNQVLGVNEPQWLDKIQNFKQVPLYDVRDDPVWTDFEWAYKDLRREHADQISCDKYRERDFQNRTLDDDEESKERWQEETNKFVWNTHDKKHVEQVFNLLKRASDRNLIHREKENELAMFLWQEANLPINSLGRFCTSKFWNENSECRKIMHFVPGDGK